MNLWLDGMGHYATAEIAGKYTTVDSDRTTWSIAAEGRFNNCLKRETTSDTVNSACGEVTVSPLMTQAGPWTPTSSGVTGFAIKVNDLGLVQSTYQGNAHAQAIFTLNEGSGPIFSVALNPEGTFSAYYHSEAAFGVNNTYVGTSIQGLRSNSWAYFEVEWLVHFTAGHIIIRMNGVQVFSYTGRVYGSSFQHGYTGVWTTARYLRIPGNTGLVVRADTMYLWDREGALHNDFAGDGTIDVIMPNGVGQYAQWTPHSGANWLNVSEIPPDGDTSFNAAATAALRDSYAMQDLPTGSIPICYQTLLYARKEVEGSASLTPTLRLAATDYDSNEQGISDVNYRYLIQPYDTNPNTGLAITEAEVDAMEAGMVKSI